MSRQIDQEIIQATNELQEDVRLTHDIVTGDENTIIEVSPGNQVRSPKKMIEDAYAETKQESGELLNQLRMQGGRKNLLINGDFAINQRGKAIYEDITVTSYTLDRWYVWPGGDVEQVVNTSPASVKYAVRLTTRNNEHIFASFNQRIENGFVALEGKPSTLSFYIRSNKTGKISTVLYDEGNRTILRSIYYQVSQANSWEKKVVTFSTITKPAGAAGFLTFYLTNELQRFLTEAGDWVEITAVQLEIGETATEFEVMSPSTELALCQRYYERATAKPYFFPAYSGTNTRYANVFFKATKRATPTFSSFHVTGTNNPVTSVRTPTKGSVMAVIDDNVGTGSVYYLDDWEANAEI